VRRARPDAVRTWTSGVLKLVVRFVAIFLLTTALLVSLWSFIAPAYTAVVTAVARPLLHAVEAPDVSVLEVRGAEIWIYRIVGPGEIAPFTWFDRYTFFAVIPLLALLVATPGLGWARRILRIGWGLGALLAVQIGYVVASIELSYAAVGLSQIGAFAARTLDVWQIAVRVVWEAAPIAIWIAMTFGVWREILRKSRNERHHETLSTEAIGASR